MQPVARRTLVRDQNLQAFLCDARRVLALRAKVIE
jgi:hypothetical protein